MEWLGHDFSQMVYSKMRRKECILTPKFHAFRPVFGSNRNDDRTFCMQGTVKGEPTSQVT